MIQILGIASEYPRTSVTDRVLPEIDDSDRELAPIGAHGITNRFSVLPEEFIRSEGNGDKFAGAKAATISPSELAAQAVRNVFTQAGTGPEAIGLFVGDSTNPLETCPSEGQRITGKLGLKTESFDIVVADSSFSTHLVTLDSWKTARLPQLSVCMSVSTATRNVDYRSGGARRIIGDGAAAMLVSKTRQGKLRVPFAYTESASKPGLQVQLGVFGESAFGVPSDIATTAIEASTSLAARALEGRSIPKDRLRLIGPALGADIGGQVAERLGIASENLWNNTATVGCLLGTSPWAALADSWKRIERGDWILVISAGIGTQQGVVLLEAS